MCAVMENYGWTVEELRKTDLLAFFVALDYINMKAIAEKKAIEESKRKGKMRKR